jgi:hypothetical protein
MEESLNLFINVFFCSLLISPQMSNSKFEWYVVLISCIHIRLYNISNSTCMSCVVCDGK